MGGIRGLLLALAVIILTAQFETHASAQALPPPVVTPATALHFTNLNLGQPSPVINGVRSASTFNNTSLQFGDRLTYATGLVGSAVFIATEDMVAGHGASGWYFGVRQDGLHFFRPSPWNGLADPNTKPVGIEVLDNPGVPSLHILPKFNGHTRIAFGSHVTKASIGFVASPRATGAPIVLEGSSGTAVGGDVELVSGDGPQAGKVRVKTHAREIAWFGDSGLFLASCLAPAQSQPGGGTLYVEGGALKYRGSAGTVTTIGAP